MGQMKNTVTNDDLMQEQLADFQCMQEAEGYDYVVYAEFNCPNCDGNITHHEHKANGICDECYKGK